MNAGLVTEMLAHCFQPLQAVLREDGGKPNAIVEIAENVHACELAMKGLEVWFASVEQRLRAGTEGRAFLAALKSGSQLMTDFLRIHARVHQMVSTAFLPPSDRAHYLATLDEQPPRVKAMQQEVTRLLEIVDRPWPTIDPSRFAPSNGGDEGRRFISFEELLKEFAEDGLI